MGLLKDLAASFVDGFVTGARAEILRQQMPGIGVPHFQARIENLCQAVGWNVNERNGQELVLYFQDEILGKRNLSIVTGDTGQVALLSVRSAAALPARQLPPEVLAYCLKRNGTLTTGAWELTEANHGNMTFCLSYCALVEGMDSSTFQFICNSLITEAAEFDKKMRAAGVL
jgi:hypothetical protein